MVTPLMEPTTGIGRLKEHDSHLPVDMRFATYLLGRGRVQLTSTVLRWLIMYLDRLIMDPSATAMAIIILY